MSCISDAISGVSKRELLEYLHKNWGHQKPVYLVFEAESGKYLYDTGTGNIVRCNSIIYRLLELIKLYETDEAVNLAEKEFEASEFTDSMKILLSTMDNQGILKGMPENFKFYSRHFMDLDTIMKNEMGHIVLEVTESCNLRCSYCLHDEKGSLKVRKHGNRDMNPETAYKAIDYLIANSVMLEQISVTFYGGEPLLRFDFVKKCIEYARRKAGNKKVTFSLTTNLLLMNEEISAYLASEKVALNMSIDGPENVHDSYRRDKAGNGTFDKVIKGLEMVIGDYGDNARDLLGLSMVYTPPYYKGKMDEISGLWEKYPFLKEIIPSITYTKPDSIKHIPLKPEDYIEEETMSQWMRKKFKESYINKSRQDNVVREIAIQALLRFFRSSTYDYPEFTMELNGCCMPGVRKLYVTVDGTIRLCERISNDTPALGHIDKPLDAVRLKKIFVNSYSKESLDDCSKCWLNKLCWICYVDTYSDEKFDLKKKRYSCNQMRSGAIENMAFYVELLDIDSEGLNFLNQISMN